MIAKHLEHLAHYLLDLAGVPSQIADADSAEAETRQPGSDGDGALQPVPIKNFLHYL